MGIALQYRRLGDSPWWVGLVIASEEIGRRGEGVMYQWKWHPQLNCTSSGTVSGAGAGALPDEGPLVDWSESESYSISTSRGLLQTTQRDILGDIFGVVWGVRRNVFGR